MDTPTPPQRTKHSMGSSCPLSYMQTQAFICGMTGLTRIPGTPVQFICVHVNQDNKW